MEILVIPKEEEIIMKQFTKVAAVMAAAALTLTACGGNDAGSGGSEGGDESSTVKLGIVNLPIFAPVYVADAKGYFEDEGIDIQLETVKSGQDAVPLASSGQLDAVAAGFSAGMFSAIESGLEVKIVASMGVSDGSEDSPTELVVSKKLVDSGEISDIADLQGRPVGAAGGVGGTGAFLLALALETEGLTLQDVNVTNLGNPDMPAALSNGSLDAGLISAPFSHHALEDGTGESLWVPPAGVSGTGMIFGEKFATSENAQAFFNAVARAAQDLQGDDRYSEENLKIIAEATGQTPEQVKAVPLYTWEPDLAPKPEQLQKMEEVWMGIDALQYEEPLNPDDYVDSSFSEKVED